MSTRVDDAKRSIVSRNLAGGLSIIQGSERDRSDSLHTFVQRRWIGDDLANSLQSDVEVWSMSNRWLCRCAQHYRTAKHVDQFPQDRQTRLRNLTGSVCTSSSTITLPAIRCSFRHLEVRRANSDSKNCTLVVTTSGESQFCELRRATRLSSSGSMLLWCSSTMSSPSSAKTSRN